MKTPEEIREEKARLRAELEETQAAYHALLAEVSMDDLERPTANPTWNVRQMLFHIIVALRFLPQDIRMLRSGHFIAPPPALFDHVNDWYTRWHSRMHTPASLADTYDREHQKLLALLAEISDEDWEKRAVFPDIDPHLSGEQAIPDLFHYISVHFKDHAQQIREALAAGDA